MSTRNRQPANLEPYLRLPPETSLIVLTGTLGCSPNWLTARFVARALQGNHDDNAKPDGSAGVLFVSWMRDLSFWKTEIRRATGVDVAKASQQGHFTLLSTQNDDLTSLQQKVSSAIATQKAAGCERVILVLDNPDISLAMGSTTAVELSGFIMPLRAQLYSTVLVCSADSPFLSAAVPGSETSQPPIEVETAAFLTQQAHAARYVMSVRDLETGAAKDVSGVLRVTRGVCAYDDGGDDGEWEEVREMEALYLVQRDGSAKVFDRGADS